MPTRAQPGAAGRVARGTEQRAARKTYGPGVGVYVVFLIFGGVAAMMIVHGDLYGSMPFRVLGVIVVLVLVLVYGWRSYRIDEHGIEARTLQGKRRWA